MAEASETSEKAEKTKLGKAGGGLDVHELRTRLAQVVWAVARVFAVVLVVGALCVLLELNQDNAIVEALVDGAGALDFGVFKTFDGDDAVRNEALVNWSIAAAIWLGIGKALERIIRP